MLERSHAVAARIVLYFGQTQRFHERRHVHTKPTAQALLGAIPAADRIFRIARPSLYATGFGRFLFVGASELHPVAVGFEHGVQVFYGPRQIAELRAPDYAHDDGRVNGL